MQFIRNKRTYRFGYKWLIAIGIISLVIILGLIITIFLAGRPMRQAESRSVTVAENDRGVKHVNGFYSSDLNHVYYTVKGICHHQPAYVIVSKHYRPLRVVKASLGVNRTYVVDQVKLHNHPKKIINAAPAIFDGQVVWIVNFESHNGKLNYQIFRYSTGHSIQLITNL